MRLSAIVLNVVCSQSPAFDFDDVEKAKSFIWEYMSTYDKELMIKMSSVTFIERPELKFYQTVSIIKEGIPTC